MAPHKVPATWIVVADGKEARIYTRKDHQEKVKMPSPHPDARLFKRGKKPLIQLNNAFKAQPMDKELGRHSVGRTYDSSGPGRHIMEPHTDAYALEKQQFASDIVSYLEEGLKQGSYGRLIIAADPKTLGNLRKLYSKAVKNRIAAELDKDLTHLTQEELQQHLEEVVFV